MKRITLVVLVIACTICFCINTNAEEVDQYIVSIDNIDVIFDSDSLFSNEDKQVIAEHILFGQSNTQVYGLICNLFGHKTTTEFVTTITHEVNDTAPRCLEEYWKVTTCSRCDYVETTRISYGYKNCCPES